MRENFRADPNEIERGYIEPQVRVVRLPVSPSCTKVKETGKPHEIASGLGSIAVAGMQAFLAVTIDSQRT